MEYQNSTELINQVIDKYASDCSPKQKKKLVETISNSLAKGIPMKESLGLNDDTMELLYSQAHHLFTRKKYKNSGQLFQVLYLLNPMDSRYALGVAASHQMNKEYETAIGWYLALTIIDPNSPLPYYYTSDCLLKLNQKKACIEFLKKTMEYCGNAPEFQSLKERSHLMIQTMEKQEVKTTESL